MHSSNENYQAKRTALVLAPSTTTESIDGATAAYQAETDSQSVLLKWFAALKQILPIYLSIHLAFLILTYGSALFSIGNFSPKTLPISTLWLAWYRWDSGHFTAIASNGYDAAWRTAFFPLFPLLVFPTAFFFAAAYNESLFLVLTLLSFYHMRRGNWWLAGLFGLLASLTRSAGLVLFLPFCYEYLRQHHFSSKNIRFDSMSSLGIPVGLAIFALHCYYRFHDLLSFSHALVYWDRHLHGPWHGLIDSFMIILHRGMLSFDSIHNVLDLSACLFILALLVLCFVGPWKFPRAYRVYGFYAALIYIFILLFPTDGGAPLASYSRYMLEVFPVFIVLAALGKRQLFNLGAPLASYSRYMLEVFPVFIVLAALGKRQWFNLYYLVLSVSILSFMLLQFLTGHWIV